ncbi:MAG: hypothetical protein FJ278_16600 [Planctomycetes bacterium]|nr:hypothetical protein [Planctomycetota bacterium]
MTEPAEKEQADRDAGQAEKPASEKPEPKPMPPEAAESLKRCLACDNVDEKPLEDGSLRCKAYGMFVNAASDEIPDDCAKFEPKGTAHAPAAAAKRAKAATDLGFAADEEE